MSGRPWTPERRAAFAAAMRERWRRGDYAKRRRVVLSPAERARRQAHMRRLNFRMSFDENLKSKCVAGQRRVRRQAAWRNVQAAVMREIMARPGMREKARQHCRRINKNPRTRKRQWAGRRRKKPRG